MQEIQKIQQRVRSQFACLAAMCLEQDTIDSIQPTQNAQHDNDNMKN